MEWIALVWVALAAVGLLYLGRRFEGRTAGKRNPAIALNLRYQPLSLVLAVLLLVAIWATTGVSPQRWLGAGNLSAPATDLAWLGVTQTDTWATVGALFAVIMTVVTGITLWIQVAKPNGLVLRALPRFLWIAVAVALVNSLVEELIFRVAVIQALEATWPAVAISAASAVLFGVPHYFGKPGGPVGVLLAGFMGWLLTASILQTGGIGWAWFIHFVLDVVILVMVFAAAAKTPSPKPAN